MQTENQYPAPGAKLADHPISQVVPMMNPDERTELIQSLKADGQRHDIVLFEGKILDGRNRYEACIEAGIEPRFRFYDPRKDGGSAAKFVAIENVFRRNLTVSQRSAVAVEMLPFYEAEAAVKRNKNQPVNITPFSPEDENQDQQEPEPPKAARKVTAAAAKAVGVSTRSVESAVALKKADPEAFKEVKEGTTTLNKATAKQDKARLALAEYEDALARIQSLYGLSFIAAVKEGTRLKTRSEVLALAALKDEDMLRIRGLIQEGWAVKKAVAYKIQAIGRTHSIGDLVNRAAAQSGMFNLEIDGWMITVQRIKEE